MITYNIRYRGPFEYEKFVLNIMQHYNETKEILDEFLEYKEKTIDNLSESINTLFSKSIQPNSLSEEILKLKILKG